MWFGVLGFSGLGFRDLSGGFLWGVLGVLTCLSLRVPSRARSSLVTAAAWKAPLWCCPKRVQTRSFDGRLILLKT